MHRMLLVCVIHMHTTLEQVVLKFILKIHGHIRKHILQW